MSLGIRRLLSLLALVALVACDTQHEGQREEVVRPVTVLTLQTSSPARDSRRVGVAVPFREEDVGFEVGGRVLQTVDAGIDVGGPVRNEANRLIREGDVIAVIDSTRYVQDLQSIQAKIAARKASLAAQRIEVNEVAKAELDLAEVTYERQRRLVSSGAASQELLDEAKSRLDVAQATLKLRTAEVIAGQAEVADLEQSLEQAELNLRDCVLRAPFTARVTALHVARGAYVSPGQPVATLTLFDPINVAVAVSAIDDHRIGVGSLAYVLPTTTPGGAETEPCAARVQEKSQVADADTRTFDVELITRNQRYPSTGRQWVSQGRFIPAIRRHAGEAGPVYVGLRCVVEDGGQHYVYQVEGVDFWQDRPEPETLMVRRVPVELGDDYWSVLGWSLRELRGDSLPPGAVIALDPERHGIEEGPLDLERHDWLLRPGDVVEVAFQLGSHPAGFYVPVSAIHEQDGATSVLLAVEGRAKAVAVEVHETYRDTRRVSGEGLRDGAELIVRGAHYVVDGERVSARAESPR